MGMSKEEKAIQQKILIRKTMNNMNKYINQLEPQKKVFIDKAKQARLKGAAEQEKLAKNALKQVLAQQRIAETMLLNLEITSQMKDLTSLTSGFISGLTTVSKEMSKIADSIDFEKAQKTFTRASLKSQTQSERIQSLMEIMGESFEVTADDLSTVPDSEIDALINNQVSTDEMQMDNEIEAKLSQMTGKIKE